MRSATCVAAGSETATYRNCVVIEIHKENGNITVLQPQHHRNPPQETLMDKKFRIPTIFRRFDTFYDKGHSFLLPVQYSCSTRHLRRPFSLHTTTATKTEVLML
ncbi:hypothetical protein Lalb_Chr02g0153931 [Lupinus albus]|uniref:Uncharacterized protein n=1 Tax=Lupinus albus TaxID=3870 RepID=A0A6A4R070_LUPAL|nr:hypothetical protein Lalb_Chr02g0153931 [Lupinus albus]